MRGFRLNSILAGTALALVLTAPGLAFAAPDTPAAIEAAVPMPESADLPPPTVSDFMTPATPAPVAPAAAILPAPAAQPETAATPAPDATPVEAKAPAATPAQTETAKIDQAAADQAAANQAVVEKVRDLVTTKLSRYVERKSEREGVTTFYASRNYAPVWTDNGVVNSRANAAIAYLKSVATEGLDPADYPIPDFAKATDPDALADAEMRLTDSVLTFARHAQTGRVHYSRVSADITYNLVYPEAADVLGAVTKAANVGDVLASYNPQHAEYKALKAKLAEARLRQGDGGVVRIATGRTIKIGRTRAAKGKPAEDILMQDPRVPQLRARLGVPGDPADTTYDETLMAAVKKFQSQHKLRANGQVTKATIEALNGPRRDRDVDIILANMERWRWVPRDLGKVHVILNIPDYTLHVYNNGKTVWSTKVVTGKPGRMATPLLSETIKFITINPTWNVPPSIINNEYLPALQQDPDALARIGLKVTQNADGSVRIYQPPGDGNALGRIRFNFPNKFLVYQHDTPDKNLFAHAKRAYSHGCMRVQYPDKYAEVLLGLSQPNEGWTVEKIHKHYGNTEMNVNLVHPIPVHITYQTAFVDDSGQLQIRDDVYGRDAAVLAELKGDDRKNADVAIARNEGTHVAVRKDIELPDRIFSGGRSNRDGNRYASSYQGGPSFFERLFGGANFGAPPPPAPTPYSARTQRYR